MLYLLGITGSNQNQLLRYGYDCLPNFSIISVDDLNQIITSGSNKYSLKCFLYCGSSILVFGIAIEFWYIVCFLFCY